MARKLVQREISLILDSNENNGAIEKSADGSAFSVQLDQAIYIPSHAINPTLDVEESAVWYSTPNIYDGSGTGIQNNTFKFFYSKQALRIELNLSIPEGVYSLSDIETAMNNAIKIATNNYINTNAISLSPSPDGGRVQLQVLYLDRYLIDGTNSDFTIYYGPSTITLSIPNGIYTIGELQTQINDLVKANTSITSDFVELSVNGLPGFAQFNNLLKVIWTDGVFTGSIEFPLVNGLGNTIGFNDGVIYNYNISYTSGIRNGQLFFDISNSLSEVLGFESDTSYLASSIVTGTKVPRINDYNFYLLRMDIVDRGIRFNDKYHHIVEVILIDVAPGQQILTRPVHPPTIPIDNLIGRPINRIRVELLKDDLTPAPTGGENYYARICLKYWELIQIR